MMTKSTVSALALAQKNLVNKLMSQRGWNVKEVVERLPSKEDRSDWQRFMYNLRSMRQPTSLNARRAKVLAMIFNVTIAELLNPSAKTESKFADKTPRTKPPKPETRLQKAIREFLNLNGLDAKTAAESIAAGIDNDALELQAAIAGGLAGEDVPESILQRLVDKYQLDPEQFGLSTRPGIVPVQEPTVHLDAAALAVLGLDRLLMSRGPYGHGRIRIPAGLTVEDDYLVVPANLTLEIIWRAMK